VRWRWFEGATEHGSTNNCLESFNNMFKNSVTDRQRLSLTEFIPALRNCIGSISMLAEYREENLSPEMKMEDMRKAYEMQVKHRKFKSFGQGLLISFY
jgi:hypothetical protein